MLITLFGGFAQAESESLSKNVAWGKRKRGRTELGEYSGKFVLAELLACGECGSPHKRVTWAGNGIKRIVWRCVFRLEFGTKYCAI